MHHFSFEAPVWMGRLRMFWYHSLRWRNTSQRPKFLFFSDNQSPANITPNSSAHLPHLGIAYLPWSTIKYTTLWWRVFEHNKKLPSTQGSIAALHTMPFHRVFSSVFRSHNLTSQITECNYCLFLSYKMCIYIIINKPRHRHKEDTRRCYRSKSAAIKWV